MVLVFGGAAEVAEGAGIAVQAVHVAFAPGRVAVDAAVVEERCAQEPLQPRRDQHCCCILPQPNQIHQNFI